ncbi:glycoside hydrolase [Diplogelasinospora grovesii]|uniref:Glycoside hydrolase n=1 Tax=Diplogelasinospora grovesii TaxID=303347 RepID=A0AAN6S772_9PEZI|nr:glycoside hydrolase [Diplogelasinospora grovesii]
MASLLKKLKIGRGSSTASSTEPPCRKVFAHYMVGLTHGQSSAHWAHDIKCAKDAGIDGFALNIGPADPWTLTQLRHAYEAAEEAGDFVLFLSFDMACGAWEVNQVVELINHFKDSDAQMKVDGKPFVSTFEGPNWAENWHAVRSETGGIFLVPDWSSLGPHGVGQKRDIIDGAFSWDTWPKAGKHKVTVHEDRLYQSELRGKKYMMGVSPYFYTNLPQWGKNWYSPSESLWYDRWQQVLEIMPDFVQIITWNDYGESSYICDTAHHQIVRGAEKYTHGYDHAAFRAVLPYYIAAYKAGKTSIDLPKDQEDIAIAWYRTTPVGCGADGDTKWGQGGSDSAANGARDVISIMAVTKGATSVSVNIGNKVQKTCHTTEQMRISYFEMPFHEGTTGPVMMSMNGKTVKGPEIRNECPPCGHVIFNAVAIQV